MLLYPCLAAFGILFRVGGPFRLPPFPAPYPLLLLLPWALAEPTFKAICLQRPGYGGGGCDQVGWPELCSRLCGGGKGALPFGHSPFDLSNSSPSLLLKRPIPPLSKKGFFTLIRIFLPTVFFRPYIGESVGFWSEIVA